MKHLIKKFINIVPILTLIAGFSLVVAPASTYADCAAPANAAEQAQCDADAKRKADVCEGARAAGVVNCDDAEGAKTSFSNIITAVINILSVIVGAVSVIMIIIGGFRYVVSNGDSNGVQGAKNTIIYAIVGLVVVLFAQIIVAFVIDRATAPPEETTILYSRYHA